MKICPTCGNQLNDDAVFCAACGNAVPAAVEAAPQVGGFEPAAAQPSGGNKKALIAIIAAAAAVVVVVVVLFTTVFNSNAAAKRAVKSYLKAISNRNATKIVDMLYPKPVLEDMEDEWDTDKDDLIDGFEDSFEDLDDEYGDDWKVKDIKIKKVKDLKDDDFEDLQEDYEDDYDMKITDAKEVKVEFKVEGDDDDDKMAGTITVIKYKGKWYIEDDDTDVKD